MGEYLSVSSQTLSIGSPDKFHLYVVHSLFLVLVIKPTEEPGIEAHLSKETSIGI